MWRRWEKRNNRVILEVECCRDSSQSAILEDPNDGSGEALILWADEEMTVSLEDARIIRDFWVVFCERHPEETEQGKVQDNERKADDGK